MKSATLDSFWDRSLDESTKLRAKKVYRLWSRDPFHPSLRFKCINVRESIWSVHITHGCHALGILEGDTVTWFWIGSHGDYERFFS